MVPCGFETFASDAAFESCFQFEQVEGDAIEQRKVLRGVAGAFAVEVFAEADIEHQCPPPRIFDAPVLADDRVRPRRIRPEAGDVVADLALDFAGDLPPHGQRPVRGDPGL